MTSLPRKKPDAAASPGNAPDTSKISPKPSLEPPGPDCQPISGTESTPPSVKDAGQPPGELERELALLSRLLVATRSKFRYHLERAHYVILVLLEDQGPLPIGTVAETLLLDNSTASRQIAAMERMGLAERSGDPTDQRRSIVRSTEKGREMMAQMRASRIEDTDFIVSEWAEEDRECFTRLLKRYNSTLIRKLSGKAPQWNTDSPDEP